MWGWWMIGRSSSMLQSSPRVRPSLLITDYCLASPNQSKKGQKGHVVIAWLILYECIEKEQAWGFGMFLADQQAGIPSGMLVTAAWVLEPGRSGGLRGTGANPSLIPPPFRRPQRGSGCGWPCDCRGRSLDCCWTMRGSPYFWSAARSRPVPWRSGHQLSLWWTRSWSKLAQAPCSSSRDCGGNAPRSLGHMLCWLE